MEIKNIFTTQIRHGNEKGGKEWGKRLNANICIWQDGEPKYIMWSWKEEWKFWYVV